MFERFLQIAGVIDQEEAKMLCHSGVKYLGFPLRLPVNKEDITEEEASIIINSLPPEAKGILITYLSKSKEVIKLAEKLNSNIIQLHGEISTQELKQLKKDRPSIKIIKSLIVGKATKEELKESIGKMSELVDAFITDSYNPSTGATGATGIVHDWQISMSLIKESSKPVILAGGLTPENVYTAITSVRPAGVDVHTGVEDSQGRKSKEKVIKFVAEATKAFNDLEFIR